MCRRTRRILACTILLGAMLLPLAAQAAPVQRGVDQRLPRSGPGLFETLAGLLQILWSGNTFPPGQHPPGLNPIGQKPTAVTAPEGPGLDPHGGQK